MNHMALAKCMTNLDRFSSLLLIVDPSLEIITENGPKQDPGRPKIERHGAKWVWSPRTKAATICNSSSATVAIFRLY